jgi:hypothetical protein
MTKRSTAPSSSYGREYEGGGVPNPEPERAGEYVRFLIARPNGSLATLKGGAGVCSPIVRPKNISGEVQAAIAWRMWFVRNDRATRKAAVRERYLRLG